MNKKILNAIFLLVGTAVGSGMITLPMVLSQINFFGALLCMLLCALSAYGAALVRCELNLQSSFDFTLEDVGRQFSGKKAAFLGNFSLKLLSFSLLAAYIFGLSDTIAPNSQITKIAITIGFWLIFLYPSHQILRFNRCCCLLLMGLLGLAIFKTFSSVDFQEYIPQTSKTVQQTHLFIILPILFTGFGFHGSLHSLTKFCKNDAKMIHMACFWGSLISASIYLIWSLSLLRILKIKQNVLTQILSLDAWIALLRTFMPASLIYSLIILTIFTSILGVGVALMDDLRRSFHFQQGNFKQTVLLDTLALLPPLVVALWIPEAFINVLSIAGCILVVLAIFLPLFLLKKVKKPLHFTCLQSKTLRVVLFLWGILIILCETCHLCHIF